MSEFKTPSLAAQAPSGHDTPGAAVAPQALTERIAQGAHRTIDKLAETAAPHVQDAEDAYASARQQVKQQARQARDTGNEWADGLRVTVRCHPLAALATAFAVGALMARITR